ncbi:sugar ABC transporter substrate-binding protein [Clostridium brassicae]|uniref:Maltodextrin-binding protein n=1 Tax=Clostridium brassicae TaxID=2999072 RepID=A0ABT4D8M6_9CLOT|nr:maltose ABC transporter substrate-binding protein [Clostridium brassicae]MCY6958645.1 maltose ABC transporter substrate-binding protein [Clostridium brassicae]
MGKHLKKVVSLVTGLIVASSIFTGCGSNADNKAKDTSSNGETVKLSFWHGWTGAEEKALGEIIKKFEAKNPNIKVETLPTPFDKLNEKLKASLPTNESPDLFLGPNDWIGTFATLNQLEEVDSYISDVKDNYLPNALEAGKFNGKQYAFPDSVKTYVLIYNKDLVPSPPKTIEEMRKIAKVNTKSGKYGLVFDITNFYYDYAFFAGYGGKVFKDEKGTIDFSQKGVADSINLLNDIKNKDKVTIKDFDYNVMMDLMQTGKAAMIINGPWCFGDLDKAVKEGKGLKNWGAVKLPVIEEGKPLKPYMGTEMLFMSKNGKHKEEAAKFIKFMTSAESQEFMNKQAGHVPANVKVNIGDDWKTKIILEQAKESDPMPNIAEMGQVWDPAKEMYSNVFTGKSTPEKSIKDTQDKINKLIKSMHGE